MEAKVAAVHEALDSLVSVDGLDGFGEPRIGGSAPAACAADQRAPTGVVRGRYAPDDRGALLERLRTYAPSSWFAMPPPLAPPHCARLGWRCVGPGRLACEFCGARVTIALPPGGGATTCAAAAERFAALLWDNHQALCPWRARPSPAALLVFPPAPAARLAADHTRRAAALERAATLPDLSAAALQRIVVGAARLDGGAPGASSIGSGGGGGGGGSGSGSGRPGEAALAALLGVPADALARLAGGGSDGGGVGGAGGAAADSLPHLHHSNAAGLLALCGWELAEAPGTASSSSGGARRGALRCLMCAAGWPLPAGAPSKALGAGGSSGGQDAKRSRLERLASKPREELLALWRQHQQAEGGSAPPEQQQQQQQQAEGEEQQRQHQQHQQHQQSDGSGQQTGSEPSPTAAPGGPSGARASPNEVSATLSLTIAGGSLAPLPASASPTFGRGPFGTPAGAAPVFGCTSPGSSGGGGGHGPFGAAGGGVFGRGAEPVFGLGAIDVEVRKRRLSSSAAGTPGAGAGGSCGSCGGGSGQAGAPAAALQGGGRGGGCCAGGGGGAECKAGQPVDVVQDGAPLHQDSAAAFDPLSAHRCWCPWAAASPDAGANAPGAGWARCLLALSEMGAAAPARAGAAAALAFDASSGAGAAEFDVRAAEEDVRRSRAAMQAKVRAALDAIRGA